MANRRSRRMNMLVKALESIAFPQKEGEMGKAAERLKAIEMLARIEGGFQTGSAANESPPVIVDDIPDSGEGE